MSLICVHNHIIPSTDSLLNRRQWDESEMTSPPGLLSRAPGLDLTPRTQSLRPKAGLGIQQRPSMVGAYIVVPIYVPMYVARPAWPAWPGQPGQPGRTF